MAGRIQGITVEIGGDTTKLQTALKGVNTEIRNTQSQLRDVDNEVALTYDHGIHTAQKTNLKQMNKDCNYLLSNGITIPDELEELIQKKIDAVSKKEGVINDKRAKVREYRDRLKSLDNYEKYKPVFEESQRIFFKSKKAEFQKAHRNELNQYHKAERELDLYLVDGSMDAARELWNEKINTLKDEITSALKNKQKAEEITEPEDMGNDDESDEDDPVSEEDFGEDEGDEESEEDEDSSDEPDDEDGEE